MRFERKGKDDPSAGLRLLESFRKDGTNLASILLSADPGNADVARRSDYAFLYKHSRHILHGLRNFIVENLGFGDFVFRDKHGEPIDRAVYLAEFEKKLQTVPQESLIYHAEKNHFSAWLMARGEIEFARNIRKMKARDFENTDAMRRYLIDKVLQIQKKRNKGEIIKFHKYSMPEENEIILLADGSLGGKGRGLAFLNALMTHMEKDKMFKDTPVRLPNTAAIGISEYERFIERNRIDSRIHEGLCDEEIDNIFLECELSESLRKKLRQLLERVHYPLAVRSSSLLEDSYSQPFAGIYRTYMLANNDEDPEVRMSQLENAIKLIYASSYSTGTQQYIEHIGHQMDEEKMAVIIQEVIGTRNANHYFPHISGVAQSYNFYPISNQRHEDGMAALAVGLGKMVIEGGNVFRFCPAHPKVTLMSEEEVLTAGQRDFFALDMESGGTALCGAESTTLVRLPLSRAESYGRLRHLVSVYDYENDRLWPGTDRKGPRIVTFDNILKYGYYPMGGIIRKLLSIGEASMGMPVEIEFAVDLDRKAEGEDNPKFYLLQIRPLAVSGAETLVELSDYNEKDVILYTERGMGNGEKKNIHDIIWCPPENFDPMQTLKMRTEIEDINRKMKKEDRSYILMGPGRWGTQDRFIGVPVQFANISQACAIVETVIEGFEITPSQGTHFFHNMVAMQIGYFAAPYVKREGVEDFINKALLENMRRTGEGEYFRHLRSSKSINIKMDGKTGRAVMYIAK
jgi:hypothetical protein